jgi:quinol monooxygenase YgiN
MIHATIRIVTSHENHDDAFAILSSIAKHIRVESGCIACRVYQNAHEDRALLFEEIWKSEAELKRHIRSEEYLNILLVVEMAVEKPEIRFETVSHVTGMETIEKVRAGSIINT